MLRVTDEHSMILLCTHLGCKEFSSIILVIQDSDN